MLHLIKLSEKDYKKKLEMFLKQYLKCQLLIDNQWLELFKDVPKKLKTINIDQEIPLFSDHLFKTAEYLQEKVKYFTLSDLVKYSICNDEIYGSRAYYIKNIVDDKTILFNSYIKNDTKIEVKGQSIKVNHDENFHNFVNYDEFCGILQKSCPNLFLVLLGSKILSSSFFFNEFVDVFGYKYEYSILNNKFFNNFNEWKNFANAIGYSDFFSTLDQQKSFNEAKKYLQTKFNITNFENIPYSVFQKDNVFCKNARLFRDSENNNSENYCVKDIHIKYTEPITRNIILPGEKAELYQNPYDFYMQHVLNLKRKSINSIIIKNITNSILHGSVIDKNLIINSTAIIKFIEKIRKEVIISKNNIFYKKCLMFVAFSEYEINKIKAYARSKELFKIFIANFKTFNIDEYNLRKPKRKNFVKISY